MSHATAIPPSSAYASIMVLADVGADTDSRVKFAGRLADHSSSRLIGLAAREINLPVYSDGSAAVATELFESERERALEDLAYSEKLFRQAAGTRNNVEWRSCVAAPREWICDQARAADLVVASRRDNDGGAAEWMKPDPADLVMNLGRPLLLLPPRAEPSAIRRVVIAWKNTREARRTVWDSLPLLKAAEDVVVVALGRDADREGAGDVSDYLRLHQVESRFDVRTSPCESVAYELTQVASQVEADLLVCGAYGHSRGREWFFGGVTRERLAEAKLPCLLSH